MLKHLMTARGGVLLVAILVIVLVCRSLLAPSAMPTPRPDAQESAVKNASVPPPPAPGPPSVALSAALATTAQPFTDDRRTIFDTPDVMRTLHQVRNNGTPDEKKWALYLLVICVHVNGQIAHPLPEPDRGGQDDPAGASAPATLAAVKKQALDALALRCRDVKSLRLEDRRALQADLRNGAASSRSVLARLDDLAMAQEDRWSSVQAQEITDALYGGDPALAREAFFVLLGAMDRDSPGGQDRNLALQAGLGPIFTGTPLSDFERLDMCSAVGKCGAAGDFKSPEPPSNSEVARLARKYRDAIESHMDARSIMAIR